jgi:hypothetical protein
VLLGSVSRSVPLSTLVCTLRRHFMLRSCRCPYFIALSFSFSMRRCNICPVCLLVLCMCVHRIVLHHLYMKLVIRATMFYFAHPTAVACTRVHAVTLGEVLGRLLCLPVPFFWLVFTTFPFIFKVCAVCSWCLLPIKNFAF